MNSDDEDLQTEFMRKLHPVTKIVIGYAVIALTLLTLYFAM